MPSGRRRFGGLRLVFAQMIGNRFAHKRATAAHFGVSSAVNPIDHVSRDGKPDCSVKFAAHRFISTLRFRKKIKRPQVSLRTL
jgi:hypothetical protein